MTQEYASEEALVPSFFRKPVEETTKLIKKKPRPEDEQTLLELSESNAWDKLKTIIEAKKSAIQDMTEESIRNTSSLEEIGLRTIINDQVQSAFQSIIDTVEMPKKARDVTRASTSDEE
jgi:hypothetical protein